MESMYFKNYILTTVRLIVAKWWLSLIKIFSLTTGFLSFLLVWLFYIDHQLFSDGKLQLVTSCSTENVLLLGFIIIFTMFVYFLVVKSQLPYRHKEMFVKKYYGETNRGIIKILMIETVFFILISFFVSLVLIDQVTPLFNLITEKDFDIQQLTGAFSLFIVFCFVFFIGIIIGILPSFWIAQKRAVDILQKLPH